MDTDELMDISIKARHKKDFQGTLCIAANYLSRADLEVLWEQEKVSIEKWLERNDSKFNVDDVFVDLSCVDKSDAVVWYLDVNVPTIGSVEEFSWAVRLKRPAYVVVKQGIKECPLWIFGMVPTRYILSSLDEFIFEIGKLDRGDKELDNRWRIFSEEIR